MSGTGLRHRHVDRTARRPLRLRTRLRLRPVGRSAAAARFADRPHVEIVEAEFPTYEAAGTGDLAIWSEVGYYLTDEGLAIAAADLDRWLEPNGHLVAVHYTGGTDYPRRGHDVAVEIDRFGFLRRLVTIIDQRFELAVWERLADT